jgi:hypothetical protein
MAYSDDVRSVAFLGKLRVAMMIVAIALLVLQQGFDLPLAWPRALAWTAAGVIGIKEARVVKRLGRSPDGYYLRAVLSFVVAALCIVY